MNKIVSAIGLVVLFALVASVPALSQDARPLPVMKTTTPGTAVPGEMVTVTGENLGARLATVYLTDGKKDWRVEVVEKSETVLKLKVLEGTPVGRYRFLAVTTDKPGVEVEQPAVLQVIAITTGH